MGNYMFRVNMNYLNLFDIEMMILGAEVIMGEIKILNHYVVINGNSFEECKSEYDRICTGVKRDFSTQCGLEELIFSNMTITDNECVAVFQIPEKKTNVKCTCVGVTLNGEW